MRYLQRKFTVTTRYGGGFVQSLEGLSGGQNADGRPVDWFYYVNGIEAVERRRVAQDRPGRPDLVGPPRLGRNAQRIPAVVGSWPEPFLAGEGGKRIPLALVCAGEERSCDEVQTRLNDEGVTGISRTGIGTAFGQKTLRIVIGPWSKIRGEAAAPLAGARPAGVRRLRPAGRRTASSCSTSAARWRRRARAPSASWPRRRSAPQKPTWIITGTDDAGVAAAAAALRTDVLNNRFAVALIDGRAESLPIRQDP